LPKLALILDRESNKGLLRHAEGSLPLVNEGKLSTLPLLFLLDVGVQERYSSISSGFKTLLRDFSVSRNTPRTD
jgi:hypothetical protein